MWPVLPPGPPLLRAILFVLPSHVEYESQSFLGFHKNSPSRRRGADDMLPLSVLCLLPALHGSPPSRMTWRAPVSLPLWWRKFSFPTSFPQTHTSDSEGKGVSVGHSPTGYKQPVSPPCHSKDMDSYLVSCWIMSSSKGGGAGDHVVPSSATWRGLE